MSSAKIAYYVFDVADENFDMTPRILGVVTKYIREKLYYVSDKLGTFNVAARCSCDIDSSLRMEKMIAEMDVNGKIVLYSSKPLKSHTVYRMMKYETKKNVFENFLNWFNSRVTPRIQKIEDEPAREFKFLERQLYKYQFTDIIYMRDFERKGLTLDIPAKFIDAIGREINCEIALKDKDEKISINTKIYGGILANEAGTGKTATSLVHSIIHNPISREQLSAMEPKNTAGLALTPEKTGVISRATFFITQNQIVKQWFDEANGIFSPSYNIKILTICDKRDWDNITVSDIINADIIITSYSFFTGKTYKGMSIVINEIDEILPTMKYINFSIFHFNRVVADEYQKEYVGNAFTYRFRGTPFDELHSNYRWILSATPFSDKNSIFECIYYLLRSGEKSLFYKVAQNNKRYLQASTETLKKCTLRITKRTIAAEMKLPKVNMNIVRIEMTERERTLYNAIRAKHGRHANVQELYNFCICPNLDEDHGTDMFLTIEEIEKKLISKHKKEIKRYENEILELNKSIDEAEMILRALGERDPEIPGINMEIAGHRRAIKNREEKLQQETRFITFMESSIHGNTDSSECEICCEPYDNDVHRRAITSCGHCFCQPCMSDVLAKGLICPMCRQNINNKTVYYISDAKKFADDSVRLGSKMAKILHYIVEKIKNTDGNILLFCIWDSICKKIVEELATHGVKSLYLQGNTTSKNKTLRLFNNPKSDYRLMSLSTKWSAEGTNLTRADVVIFVDPIHGEHEHRRNTMIQAISRSHRIGQKNDVEAVMFLMKDTIETDAIADETFGFIDDLNV